MKTPTQGGLLPKACGWVWNSVCGISKCVPDPFATDPLIPSPQIREDIQRKDNPTETFKKGRHIKIACVHIPTLKMTLSCRAQAFSVDNLLRSSEKAITDKSSSPLESVALASRRELPSLYGHNWTPSSRCLPVHQHLLTNDDNSKTAHVLHSIALENPKNGFLHHQDRIPRGELSTTKHFKRGYQDEIVHCNQIYKLPRINDDNDSKDVEEDDTASRQSSCGDDNDVEEKSSGFGSQYKASTSPRVPSSCFCLTEMNFCNHPGIMTVADTDRADTSIVAELCHADLWASFHRLGTEMIITKSGRRMFPALKLRITGLNPDKHYIVRPEFVQPDTRKYRYIYHSSRWMVSGSGDTLNAPGVHRSAERSASGQAICSQIVSFERLKLTNTETSRSGQVSLISMQKFQPQVVIQEAQRSVSGDVKHSEQYVITFPQTSFMAVTAYQNQQVTTLKIASNPFAKGFRESGKTRIPFESFMTGLPNLLSCNTPASYLHALMKPSRWPSCFQREYSSNVVTTCCDTHSAGNAREDLPVKTMTMEGKICGSNYMNFGMKRDSSSVDEELNKSPVASVSVQQLPRESHPLHPHRRHRQEELKEQQRQVLSSQQLHIQALIHHVPFNAELLQRIHVPAVDIPAPKNHLHRLSIHDSLHDFPRAAYKSASIKSERPLSQLSDVYMMPANTSNPQMGPCRGFQALDNSPRCPCTRHIDNLPVVSSLVSTTSVPSVSCVEHNWTLTRGSSHDPCGIPLPVPQTLCFTEPAETDSHEAV